MKHLGTIKISGTEYALKQAEEAANAVVEPTQVSLGRATDEPDVTDLVASVQRLDTGHPELVVYHWVAAAERERLLGAERVVLFKVSAAWRRHYRGSYTMPARSRSQRSAQAKQQSGKGNGHSIDMLFALVIGLLVTYWLSWVLEPRFGVAWRGWAILGLVLLYLGVSMVDWIHAIRARRWQTSARALLVELLEHRRPAAEILTDLSHHQLNGDAITVTLTRGHVTAVLDLFDSDRSDSAETEVRAWAQAVSELHGDGIEPSGPIRFEAGYTTALYVVLASLTDAASPWYDFTTDEGMAGMRRHLDIADSEPEEANALRAP